MNDPDDLPPPGELRFRPGEMPALFGDTAATLIVDDDPVVAEVLKVLLEPEGYRCTIVHDGPSARAAIDQHEFATALVDVMMPGESGLELVAELLAKHRDLAVVMVTAVDEPAIAQMAIDSGAYGYLTKPFRDGDVINTVAAAGHRRCIDIEHRAHIERLERKLQDSAAEDR